MDIKDLNKSQLILLAVLLSFITSIATGITTVTLMQQAPASVTVPVNRVIRQTIEKIEQVECKTTVQTVIVKEEDLVVDAIAKNRDAVFALSKEDFSIGRAFVVSAEGVLVADASLAPERGNYFAENASGKFKAEFLAANPAGFSFLLLIPPLDPEQKPVFTVPDFGDLTTMKTGQKIIILGQKIVLSLFEENKGVNLPVSWETAGGLVLNLDGEALGIALLNETSNFASIATVTEALAVLSATGQ